MNPQDPNTDDYIDLTDGTDLTDYSIQPNGFDCDIIGPEERRYTGFLLAKSPSGRAYTICDVNFHWSATDSKYAPRLVLRRTNQNLEDRPVNRGHRHQRISFADGENGYREFWRMIAFLARFKETVDLGSDFHGMRVVSKDAVVSELQTKEEADRIQEIIDYVIGAGLALDDMAGALTFRSRVSDLEVFKKLIDDEDGFREQYRTEHADEIPSTGTEAIFHHFLKNHTWIFGLNLDLRFIDDFSDEAAVGITNTDGRGEPHADMLGWNDFTVLVELKTPDAKFFKASRSSGARANTWSFTSSFIDGYSQVLAQKDDWAATHGAKRLIKEEDGVKTVISQDQVRTVNPRAIYLFGNKGDELPSDSLEDDVIVKRDTLERFTQDHRNVVVLSYDELYKRAHHIVHHTASETSTFAPPQDDGENDLDDFDW